MLLPLSKIVIVLQRVELAPYWQVAVNPVLEGDYDGPPG